MAISDDAEWTASRIKRLFRPLKCKCLALSSYLKETHTGLTTYGSRRPPPDQGLLPLEHPFNVGLRIHFSKGTVQTLDLSKKIFAIRDHYSDIITRAKISCVKEDAKSPLSSLTSLCSVILGAQISGDEDDSTEIECGQSAGDILYEVIPPPYRPRTLLMQALHTILDSCPPHAALYLSLLDLTLNNQLYHESEVLLDVTLDHAFEPSLEHLSRISNPEYQKFIVDLYCKWITQFPSAVFTRLVIGVLQRAPSCVVWTTKAVRRFARKLGRHDINSLPPLLGGLVDTILIHRRKCKDETEEIDHLRNQLREWSDMVAAIFTVSMRRDTDVRISIENEALLETLLDYGRSWLTRCRMEINDDPSKYGFIEGVVCLYTLWLASGLRTISKYDVLFGVLQRSTFPSLTYTPICRHIVETAPINECRNILHMFSSVLRAHELPQLQSSLWACALYHVEEAEIEQNLIGRSGKDEVRDFKLWLIDCVDETENDLFTTTSCDESPPEKLKHSEIPYGGGEESGEVIRRRSGESPVDRQHMNDQNPDDQLPGPPKRRKVARHPLLPSCRHPLSGPFRQSRNDSARSFNDDHSLQNTSRDSLDKSVRDQRPIPIQFTSILSDAVSSRTSLRIGEVCPEKNAQDKNNGVIAPVYFYSSDRDDASDSDDGGDADIGNLEVEQHAPSEDFLDLFRLTGASSPLR